MDEKIEFLIRKGKMRDKKKTDFYAAATIEKIERYERLQEVDYDESLDYSTRIKSSIPHIRLKASACISTAGCCAGTALPSI
jgi:hypothetical protein